MTAIARLCGLILLAIAVMMPARVAAYTETEWNELKRVSAYLSSISTMNGEFVQFGPYGDRTQGKFFLAKPGRIRFQYDPPNKIAVIADGESVLIQDRKLETDDIWPLKRTPLKFLLDDTIDFSRSEQLRSVLVDPDLVQIVLVDDSRFGGGKLTLLFDRKTAELRQWTVTDGQGLDTSVAIYNVETGNRFHKDMFKINYSMIKQRQIERGRNN